ncbi:hypothetical protein U1Q18_018147, partial [Sarracenia purpurea var. burkii]
MVLPHRLLLWVELLRCSIGLNRYSARRRIRAAQPTVHESMLLNRLLCLVNPLLCSILLNRHTTRRKAFAAQPKGVCAAQQGNALLSNQLSFIELVPLFSGRPVRSADAELQISNRSLTFLGELRVGTSESIPHCFDAILPLPPFAGNLPSLFTSPKSE